MFHFSIRDLLWLMVVVAMGVLMWSERAVLQKQRGALQAKTATERAALKKERAALQAETAAERAVLKKELTDIEPRIEKITESLRVRVLNLENETSGLRELLLSERRKAMPVSEAEFEAVKRKSAELGAPQPKPLPAGYGETPSP